MLMESHRKEHGQKQEELCECSILECLKGLIDAQGILYCLILAIKKVQGEGSFP